MTGKTSKPHSKSFFVTTEPRKPFAPKTRILSLWISLRTLLAQVLASDFPVTIF
jgi:hypothetical protein